MTLKFSKELNLILKKVSRTIYLSISVLPEYIKVMLGTGYLICRAMDTIVDLTNLSNYDKEKLLDLFIDFNLKNSNSFFDKLKKAVKALENQDEKELIEKYCCVYQLISNFPENEKRLLTMLVKGVSSGMKMDLKFFEEGKLKAFDTEKDLISYCRRIGGVPGIYWYEVYNSYSGNKLRDYNSIKYAYDIGTALQLTNILRDLKSDLAIGRCYIPYQDLKDNNMAVESLLEPKSIERFKPLLNKWITYAVDMLDSSEKFLFLIDKSFPRLRAAVIWPVYWAMDSLFEIARNNPLARKVKINRRKIYLTLIKTPSLLVSNTVFQRGYRFRRETLIVTINSSEN